MELKNPHGTNLLKSFIRVLQKILENLAVTVTKDEITRKDKCWDLVQDSSMWQKSWNDKFLASFLDSHL